MKKVSFSLKKGGQFLFYLSFGSYVVVFCTGRFVLVQEVVGARIAIQALFIDLGVAVFIALLIKVLRRLHIAVSAIVLLFLSLFHVANMEMAAALNTYINIVDLHYATDAHFMRGTFTNLTFLWYSFFLLLSAILYLFSLTQVKKNGPLRVKYEVLFLCISISSVLVLSPRGGQWHNSNLLWLSLSGSISRAIGVNDHSIVSGIHADMHNGPQSEQKDERELYFQKTSNSERNVLFVVLDGIPGVYVRQVQERTGVKYPVIMQNLSRIAEHSLIVPNFIAHNRQTIRGLYSLLSGDYPKLSITTPKIYEYVQLPRDRRSSCLPKILANSGYTTVYLQAADLAFMSKNKFMPESGFQLVIGKEYFRYQYVPFGWGPDDRAFFEQAADFIVNLNRDTKPWFVTLLNVGTHHPYAVPEEWENKFSNRKEAAIAYLDEAVGWFFNRLKARGILNDTLVLITCDESHGVTGQPYGNYWGLAIIYSPESYKVSNPSVFGLIDVPYSVLDYLGLNEVSHSFVRRSFFRKESPDRPIFFGPYFSERKGAVKKRINPSCVKEIQSSNGELFSPAYVTKIVKGEEGKRLSEELKAYQMRVDSSLFDSEKRDRRYLLLEDDVFIIGQNESRLLSSGQYLDIPAGTSVTVELNVTAELIDGHYEGGSSESIRLVLQMIQYYKKMTIPEIRIPILKDKETLNLSFSFYTEDALSRVWAYLNAKSVNHKYSIRLKVERFSIEIEESEIAHEFRINRLFIKENRERIQDLKPLLLGTVQNSEQPNSLYQSCSKIITHNNYSDNPSDTDIVSLWFEERACVLTFRVGRLDERYDQYIISVHFKKVGTGLNDTQVSGIVVNDLPVMYLWIDHSDHEKEVVLYFPCILLEQNDINTISFMVNEPVSGEDVSLNGELPTLALRPSLPPIAHAGGGYGGFTYTNSIEALEKNIAAFVLFEIDLEWTKDNQLVGIHDWGNMFTRFYGFEAQGPLKYKTFRELKTRAGFTPVDLPSIKEFLSSHPAAKIVTDIKSDNIEALYRIARCFPDFAHRFIPQIYQPDEFTKAIDIGYRHIIWTLYQYPHVYDPTEILSNLHYWRDEYNATPFAITLPIDAVEKGIAKVVGEAGVPVYVHTINTCDEYIRLLGLGISSIYTDFLDVTGCYTVPFPF